MSGEEVDKAEGGTGGTMPGIIMDPSDPHRMGNGGGQDMSNGVVQQPTQGLNKGNHGARGTDFSDTLEQWSGAVEWYSDGRRWILREWDCF